MAEPSDDQRRMAAMMNLHPDMPETWPMEIIDRFIWLKANAPKGEFEREFNKTMNRIWRG